MQPFWCFRPMSRSEMNHDPVEKDFFSVETLDSVADALVRESIQNSLDARASSSPVKVRFLLPEEEAHLDPSRVHRYFKGLRRHLEHSGVIDQLPSETEKISWLAVEDFGTRGLTGDPAAPDDPKSNERNDFYYFWRNVGRGKKSGIERGRWGLGKTMFPATSRIHSFFGVSRTQDGRSLLMGQAVLRIHKIDGVKHYPYGYFGRIEPDGFALPIADESVIEDFQSSFRLRRRTEPGLSVVVPYPRDTLNRQDLLLSVLKHYFFPILAGDLEVCIQAGESSTSITRDTIAGVASEHAGNEPNFLAMLDLAKKFLAVPKEKIVKAKLCAPNRAPRWNVELFTPSCLDEMAAKLDSGEELVIEVPVHVTPKSESPQLSHFFIALQRDPLLEKPAEAFIRQGITISGVTSLSSPGIRALVITRDDTLASFLGDAENPAHTLWQANSTKFKGKYLLGPSTLDFVKTAPRNVVRLLNKRTEVVDDKALRHLFPKLVERPRNSGPGTGAGPNPVRTAPPVVRAPKRKSPFSIQNVRGGVTISLTDDAGARFPLTAIVRCAYDVSKGNPFSRWSVADFHIGSTVTVKLRDGVILESSENRLLIRADGPSFNLQLLGFDTNRDLIVDVRLKETEHAATI